MHALLILPVFWVKSLFKNRSAIRKVSVRFQNVRSVDRTLRNRAVFAFEITSKTGSNPQQKFGAARSTKLIRLAEEQWMESGPPSPPAGLMPSSIPDTGTDSRPPTVFERPHVNPPLPHADFPSPGTRAGAPVEDFRESFVESIHRLNNLLTAFGCQWELAARPGTADAPRVSAASRLTETYEQLSRELYELSRSCSAFLSSTAGDRRSPGSPAKAPESAGDR